MTLNEAKRYSILVHAEIWNLLGEITTLPGARFQLVPAYLTMALEHQKAIVVLVDLDLRGSAFALLRLQIEAAFRGLWIGKIATEQQLEDFATKGVDLFGKLKFKDMTKQIDDAYQAKGGLQSIIDKFWTPLNGFTHTGYEQLVRRFNSIGTIVPDYADDLTESLLLCSSETSYITAGFILAIMGFFEQSKALRIWHTNNKLNTKLDFEELVEDKPA